MEKYCNKYYFVSMDISKEYTQTTKHIANKILDLRRVLDLSQEQFAEKTELDTSTIARAESGKHKPSIKTILAIAKAFNIQIEYFYNNSNYEITSKKSEIIKEINSKLNTVNEEKLNKINKIIDFI